MRKAKRAEPVTEYDFSGKSPAALGKYFARSIASMNLVQLEPDVAEVFPDGEAVNRALRMLIEIGVHKKTTGRPKRRRAKRQAAAVGRKAGNR
jgi:hypothetical protein